MLLQDVGVGLGESGHFAGWRGVVVLLVHHARCAHLRHLLSRLVAVLFQPLQNVSAAYKAPPAYLERRQLTGLEEFVHPRSSEPQPSADFVYREQLFLDRYLACQLHRNSLCCSLDTA